MPARQSTTSSATTTRWRERLVWFVLLSGLGVSILLFEILFPPAYDSRDFTFHSQGNQLAGTVHVPKEKAVRGCLVFIHGDGDIDRSASGFYDIFFDKFAEAGWCSISWDKPGVGESSGHWRDQSMSDRATEALDAIAHAKQLPWLRMPRLGLFGYSQAGWVMPKAANQNPAIDFMISVSPAIDIEDQYTYFKRNQLALEGKSQAEIDAYLDQAKRLAPLMWSAADYETYLSFLKTSAPDLSPVSEREWRWTVRNIDANARDDLRQLDIPVLAIWGDNDIYVDPEEGLREYREALMAAGRSDFQLVLFERANHSIMKADTRAIEHEGWGLAEKVFNYVILEEDAFAPSYFDLLTGWLEPPVS